VYYNNNGPIVATPADAPAQAVPAVPFGGSLREFLNKSSDDSTPPPSDDAGPQQPVRINFPGGFVQGNVPDKDNPAAASVGITFGQSEAPPRRQTQDAPSTTDNTDLIPREGAPAQVSTGSPISGAPPASANAPLGPLGYAGGDDFFDRSPFVPPPPIVP